MKTPNKQVEIWVLNARRGQRDGFGKAAVYREWLKQIQLTLLEAEVPGERLARAQLWTAPIWKDR